jgi:DHA1 family tetracycline resistance protein-like MFS transporter
VSTKKPAMWFIIVTLLLDVLGFGLLIPVAPSLIRKLEGGDIAEAAPYVGALTALYACMQFICAPILGALSDHFGRRPVLLIALLGSGLDYFAMALSPNLWFLFITRAINGMSGASFSVANAYIADVTDPKDRAKAFGLVGAAFGLGFMLGPLIGGYLGKIDIHYPFYVAGAITLINCVYGYFVLPESLKQENRSQFTLRRANPIAVFKGLGKYPAVVELAFALLFVNLAQFGLHSTWALYTEQRYGWGPQHIGMSLFLVGLGAVIVQGGLAGIIIKKIGERRALLIGMVIAILAFAGYGASTESWMIYTILILASLGGIAQPANQSLITRTVRPDEQGRTQGAVSSIQTIAQIFGPLIASNVFSYFISDKAPAKVPGASFYLGSFFCTIGLVLAWLAVRRHAAAPDTGDSNTPAVGH